jgi:uncharacterized protein
MNPSSTAPGDDDPRTFDDFTASAAMQDHAMDASSLQGLAAALAIGPRRVMPSAWLPWVWDRARGERSPAFANLEQANAILAVVMRLYNAVVAAFEGESVGFEPLFWREAQWGAAEFCEGFMIGVGLAQADWAALDAADPEALGSIRLLATADSEVLRRLGEDEAEAMLDSIVPSLFEIRDFWRGDVLRGDAWRAAEAAGDGVWTRVRDGLEFLQQPFPAAAVALAEAHRDEVAPHLVAALEAIAEDPALAEDDDYTLHLFAMHLLAGWRDRRAFAPLLAIGSVHDADVIDAWFGDLVHESYGRCLASVSGGDLKPMMALADDPLCDVWLRSAVLGGLTACVLEGDADREAVVAYLKSAAEREAAAMRADAAPGRDGFNLLDSIVAELTDLGAIEHLAAIRQWMAEGLLDPGFADLDFIESAIAEPHEEARARMLQRKQGYVADAASEMSWWYLFDPRSRWSEPDTMPGLEAPLGNAPGEPYVRPGPKIGRNDPCPCGSGRKYKKCHGAG